MKRSTKIFSYFICIAMIAAMFTFTPGFFAAEKVSAATAYDVSGDVSGDPAPEYWNITVVQAEGGTISVDANRVVKGQSVTVTVTPNKGYGVESLTVDGQNVGATYSYSFVPQKDTTVTAAFRKSSEYVFIMLDAGHYGNVNRSPVLSSYYESKMTWPLHLYLKQELEQYKNVIVDTTRSSQSKDLGVYERGTASKDYDLFLSLHSNATGSKSADYPLIITQMGNTKDALAVSLGKTIQSVMGTKQGYKVWQKLNKDGKTEYYGVLRGSKAVGTKGMIVEHSFHTNLAAAKWLSSDANLREMAEAEASDIAAYYGLTKDGEDQITPARPSVSISNTSYNSLTVKWKKSAGATGYNVYRATSKKGSYKRVKNITSGSTVSYKNSKLTTGKTYYYKVKAYRKSGGTTRFSSYSSVKSSKVKPKTPSVSSKAGKRKVTVRWKKVSGASRYVVYRATKKSGKYKTVATLKSNRRSYTNKKLKKNKRYYYKARVYRTVKGKKIYSNYSGYTMKKAK